MKVCLVAPGIATEFQDSAELRSDAFREVSTQPQLGILSLAATLEQRDCNLSIVILNREFLRYQALRKGEKDFASFAAQVIVEEHADLYGFGTICSSYPLTIRIAQAVKSSLPASTILLGGPQASIVDVHTLSAFPFIDYILRGEAEQTLPMLLDELTGQNRLERVPSVSYRVAGKPRRNESAPVIQNLDALPTPAYHLTGELAGASEASLELGRGCPFSCTFCSTNDFFRRKFRLRSPERVLADMKSIHAQYGISHFDLVHDMFTVDRRRVVAFCNTMAASNTGFTWACSARTDCIDEELMEAMHHAGCRGIFFGVETGSQRMQKIIDKHLDVEGAKQIVEYAEGFGIANTVSLIVGFPEETREDLNQSMRMFAHAARFTQSTPQLNLLAPLAGTPIYDQHKVKLVLEELCSDISHQARTQDPLDRALVAEHPEIFPNFYLIPTLHLDRAFLIELREFSLAMKARLRWLLVAIDQSSDGVLSTYTGWREHRLQKRPHLNGAELRQYYRTQLFRRDFVQFLSDHPIKNTVSVAALLAYESALASATLANKVAEARLLLPAEKLRLNDVPVRKGRTRVLHLPFDIQQVIDCLRAGKSYVSTEGRHFYVLREVFNETDRLDQVSDWMGTLLHACDGRNDIREVANQLTRSIPDLDASLAPYVCMRLLQSAREQGFISIYRRQAIRNKRYAS